ncbi:centriolar satellite-associated tubulin polyglutamylase complex regulator 1-like isoform X2 [Argopecten irradians]|uniref:centriolar satellite-associated tubulin polyglutamylase complex regulator 1-like isoform X2 n=1 Tax=Argopecten irradians TaxID=31199 RepID=UPI00371437DC
MTTEDRFSMSAEKYLAKHNILVYLEDSVAQLLEHREENPKTNAVKFFSEYFNSLRDGNHTMFREYNFVQATPHNRASFVRLFWKCYRQIGKKGDLLSIQEYHSLISLLCPDFPFEPVQKTARIILLDDALDCLISFADFIYAFQVQFYYDEFMEKCHEIYLSLMQTQRSPRDPVVVPSGTEDTKVHQNSHHPSDGVDAMQYFRAVYPLCDRSTFSTPPGNCLKEILFNVPRVSFYGFLMALAKSESINDHIGKLPPKAELLEGADSELTSNPSGQPVAINPPLTVPNPQAQASPTIRMKTKTRPVSATGNSKHSSSQNVYTTQTSSSSLSSHSNKGKNSQINTRKTKKRKDSSEESSSDSDSDSSDDTN